MKKRQQVRCVCCLKVQMIEIPSKEWEEIITNHVCSGLVCQLVLSRFKAHKPKMGLHAYYVELTRDAV